MSTVVALFGLNIQEFAFAIAIFIAVAIISLVPLILDLLLRYVLVNKVKYEEIVDALIEIQLEIVSLNGNVRNKKVRK